MILLCLSHVNVVV